MSSKEYYDKRWESMFDRFKLHVETTGTQACPPRVDRELNRWIDNQRMQIKTYSIRPDRLEKLREYGFYEDERDLVFDRIFNDLCQYKNDYGHLDVPTNYRGYNNLGNSVQSLRHKYKNGQLKYEWINKLKSIEFKFTHSEAFWDRNWMACKSLINNKGKLPVSCDEKLKTWWRHQKNSLKNGKLDSDKANKIMEFLNELGIYQY